MTDATNSGIISDMEIRLECDWDDEAGLFVARTSDESLATESSTLEGLVEGLRAKAAELAGVDPRYVKLSLSGLH